MTTESVNSKPKGLVPRPRLAQQLRKLGEVDRQPPRLVFGEQAGGSASGGDRRPDWPTTAGPPLPEKRFMGAVFVVDADSETLPRRRRDPCLSETLRFWWDSLWCA
jgi:hypothetical protein